MARQHLCSPMRAFRDTPVTYILVYAVSIMAIWLGAVILTTTVRLPAERLLGYVGPMSLFPLRVWGWWFVVGGMFGLVRPFFHQMRRVSLGLHLAKMVALLAWAISFDFGGPPTTGQPCYTFLAIISFLAPWLPAMIERRYGMRPTLNSTEPSPARSSAEL